MIRSMYTGASGMEAQQLYMDVIAQNLANVNTTGFKRQKMEFADLMYQTLKEPGVQNFEGSVAPSGIEVGLGVKAASTQRIFEQGSLNQTQNPMDLAIQGEGFFQIQLPDGGTAYSRDGSFKLSADGSVVTSSGFFVEPRTVIPEGASSLAIDARGKISAILSGDDTATEIGQIELARFVNSGGLKAMGDNLYTPTDASGEPIIDAPAQNGNGSILQGYTEASNVQIVEEMVNMISAQKAYEIVSKSITVSEEMMQTANGLKR